MNDEPRKTFTVTDRRHFTAEGDPRPPGEAPSSPPAAAPPPDVPRPAPLPSEATSPDAAPSAAPDDEGEEFDVPPVPTDLVGLVASLGTQAAYLLATPVQKEGEPRILEGVRSVITLLEVLKDKTEGRRTLDEEEVLQGVLYELRMGFVARTRVTGA